MTDLSPRQAEILEFILACYRQGWLPTWVEISKLTGLSRNRVDDHLLTLRAHGYLRNGMSRVALNTRALELVSEQK